MPAVSDSQFAPKTTQPSVLALESTETASLGDGDLGVVRGIGTAPDTFYVLDVENILAQNGVTVLWTRNSNPLFGAPAGTPGRWVLMSTALGCSCPTGPTGPSGTPAINSEFTNLGADAVTVDPAFVTLLTVPITTTGGRLLIEATVAAHANDSDTGTGSFSIGVDGDVPPLPGHSFAVSIGGAKTVCGGIVFRTAPLAAGVHTVTLYWRADASFPMGISPVSAPDHEHASLYVEEVP